MPHKCIDIARNTQIIPQTWIYEDSNVIGYENKCDGSM